MKEAYSDKGLAHETRKMSYKQDEVPSKGLRRKENSPKSADKRK